MNSYVAYDDEFSDFQHNVEGGVIGQQQQQHQALDITISDVDMDPVALDMADYFKGAGAPAGSQASDEFLSTLWREDNAAVPNKKSSVKSAEVAIDPRVLNVFSSADLNIGNSTTSAANDDVKVKVEQQHSLPVALDLPLLKDDYVDEDEELLNSEEGKKLNSRERRQLRNKVSARHFRVRRKEYITQLEIIVAQHTRETSALKSHVADLEAKNENLASTVDELRKVIETTTRKETLHADDESPALVSGSTTPTSSASIATLSPEAQWPMHETLLPSTLLTTPLTTTTTTHTTHNTSDPSTFANKDPNPNAYFDWPLAGSLGTEEPGSSTSTAMDWWQRGESLGGSVNAFTVHVPDVNLLKLEKSLFQDDGEQQQEQQQEEPRVAAVTTQPDPTSMLQIVGVLYETIGFAMSERERQKQIQEDEAHARQLDTLYRGGNSTTTEAAADSHAVATA